MSSPAFLHGFHSAMLDFYCDTDIDCPYEFADARRDDWFDGYWACKEVLDIA